MGKDIKNKILRHTSEAFYEDPLRALRLADLKQNLVTSAYMKKQQKYIKNIAIWRNCLFNKERVLQEMKKVLK